MERTNSKQNAQKSKVNGEIGSPIVKLLKLFECYFKYKESYAKIDFTF